MNAFFEILRNGGFSFAVSDICVRGLYFKLDGFRFIYAAVTILMWGMTTLFSFEYLHHHQRGRYYFFSLLTFIGTLGMFLSGDLFTAFVFFEIMSLSSYVLVAHEETAPALRAGDTYMAVAVLGGMVTLMGLFLLARCTGTLDIEELTAAAAACQDRKTLYAACGCLLFGFGAKAGMFPMHIWLPKAHPVAPAPASALLSGVLTKCGIFGILVISTHILQYDRTWGMLLLGFALVTMVLGAVLAVFSVDLKRTLACSSMSQIGFILTGTAMQCLLGEENALAVRGTLLHMVNHSLIKLVLFMAAGVVVMNLHQLNLNDIRGFGRKKPLLHFIFLMGVLGIIGMPGWNGYISKTLLHESIVEYTHHLAGMGESTILFKAAEWIFLFSGGLTAAYMTKVYICIFWEKNINSQKQEMMDTRQKGSYMNALSCFALFVPSLILPVLGMLPYRVTDRIASLGSGFMYGTPPEHAVHYFSAVNLKGGAISLGIGAAVYLLFIRRFLIIRGENGLSVYANKWPAEADLEELVYRPVFLRILPGIGGFFSGICDSLTDHYLAPACAFLGGHAADLCGRIMDDYLIPVIAFVSSLLSRIFEKLTDTFIYILRVTVFRPLKEDTRIRTFAYMRYNSKESSVQKRITSGFAFGMLLFVLGLGAALIYLVLL